MSLKAAASKLFDGSRGMQELHLTRDIVDQVKSQVDEIKKILGASQE